MTKRSEIFSIRTLFPVGLGVAIGLAVGAAALANVPLQRSETPAAAQQQPEAVKPLSTKPGVRFARIGAKDMGGGERCFAAQQAQTATLFCTH